MTRYIIYRVLSALVTVLGATFLVFAGVRFLPGSAVDVILSTSTTADAEAREAVERELGLDDPLVIGYVEWLGGVVQGDFGESLLNGEPVSRYLTEAIPVTFELGLMALVFGTFFGVPIGVVSAVTQDSWIDNLLRSVAIVLLSVPGFIIAIVTLIVASRFWGWNPPITYISLKEDPVHNLGQFALPAMILGFSSAAALMRFTRTAMLEVIREDYVRTARAKGLKGRSVVIRHALRNALIPIISVIGVFLAFIVGGTVIFEQIFQLPGLGRLLLTSANQRDYTVVQGIAVIFAIVVVLANLVTDLVYVLVDPRVRY